MNTIQMEQRTLTPSKVVCIGRNYVDHIAELNNEVPDDMVVFIKPNSAISSTLKAFQQEPIHYEGELCFVYEQGRFSAVGFGLDLTKRGLQNKLKAKGLPWERAKAFDGAALFSEFVAISPEDKDFTFELSINDEVVQQGHIGLMIYNPETILAQLSTFITLNEGDIVMTGTPKGVGEIKAGSIFKGQVSLKGQLLLTQVWQAV
ncbi:fumarylacetoacetate hydrolase family protein [Thiofilum flexile]|uniref:fumarylacetoacetate hydrolase family protein n=1 Tax=Thiofilum flexile TaxID=125627 RepID=UPI000370C78F